MSDYSVAMQESYKIIQKMGNSYITLIPTDVMDEIEKSRNKEYKFEYDENKTLEEQNVKKETFEILSYLNYMYWCKPDEKEAFSKIYKENNLKEEEKKRLKYNPDKIFENVKNNNIQINTQETALVKQDEHQNFFRKIIDKIKKFFKIS